MKVNLEWSDDTKTKVGFSENENGRYKKEWLDDGKMVLTGEEKVIVEMLYDRKYLRLLKKGIISVNDFIQGREWSVSHSPKYHESILSSLGVKSEHCLLQNLDEFH